jgi:hypothetical protein
MSPNSSLGGGEDVPNKNQIISQRAQIQTQLSSKNNSSSNRLFNAQKVNTSASDMYLNK